MTEIKKRFVGKQKVDRPMAAQALHRYESGERLKDIAQDLGVHYTTLQRRFDQFFPIGASR